MMFEEKRSTKVVAHRTMRTEREGRWFVRVVYVLSTRSESKVREGWKEWETREHVHEEWKGAEWGIDDEGRPTVFSMVEWFPNADSALRWMNDEG